jgi:hypothetical protein
MLTSSTSRHVLLRRFVRHLVGAQQEGGLDCKPGRHGCLYLYEAERATPARRLSPSGFPDETFEDILPKRRCAKNNTALLCTKSK